MTFDKGQISPFVCVVLAVFRPNENHLREQLLSIATQVHMPRWLVLVAADGTSGPMAEALAAEFFGSGSQNVTEVVVSNPKNKLDAIRAFEYGLFTALDLTDDHPDALIALSDQDDIWHKDRLSRGVAALVADLKMMMVHSDARLVDSDGAPLHDSMFAYEKRHKAPGLSGLLYRNNVTGMTTLIRRNVVDVSLPFPAQSGVHYYHDLWMALIAESMGGVGLIEAALVDYRQHDANAIGAVNRTDHEGPKFGGFRIDFNWLKREAGSYGLARYLAHSLKARLGDIDNEIGATLNGLNPWMKGFGFAHWRHAIRLFVTGHFGLARLAAGHGTVALGRMVWAVRQAWRDGLPKALLRFDRRIYGMSPGVEPPGLELDATAGHQTETAELLDLRKTPSWSPRMSAEQPCINLLIPTLNPAEAFAGIGTAIDLGLGLAVRGHHVRMIATDLPMVSPQASRRFILGRLDKAHTESGAADRLTLCCGRMGDFGNERSTQGLPELPSHIDDTFMTTAWWTTHVAKSLIDTHGYTQTKIGYLIQDFEPNFYAWGGEFADAMASYDMDILPVFNTTLLRAYFKQQGFDFARESALAFRPSIDVSRYSRGVRTVTAEGPRKLALYGRPEVARNMFPLALEALKSLVEAENLNPRDIEIFSVGMHHNPVPLVNGVVVRSLGKLPWEDYPDFLLGLDLGLSLMYSPHPSHPPLEMAASGVRVVTNDFGPKKLDTLSDAIVSAPARAADLATALSQAWHMGPVPEAVRDIDLSPLGRSLDEIVDDLTVEMALLGPTHPNFKG